ncbi:unnamed protein product [Chrysoparadoxa australica]
MLRVKHLPTLLNQVNGEGVLASILLQSDGALVGSAGEGLTEISDKVVGAITSNIWAEFERNLSGDDKLSGDLSVMLLELEGGRLGLASAGEGFLVCVYAADYVKFGLIKTKLQALSSYFKEELARLGR